MSSRRLKRPVGVTSPRSEKENIMADTVTQFFCAGMVIASLTAAASAQGLSGTANGEWPAYAGDLNNYHYSPLDQIGGANFNKLELAWRFKTDSLGPRPEFKLEGTPIMVKGVLYATAGTRRSVVALDAATGELLWVHGEHEGARGAAAARQLSGRGLSYWTDGKGDDRIVYVTPRLPARLSGCEDRSAGQILRL